MKIRLTLLASLCTFCTFAQPDTIIMYDVPTKTTAIIPPLSYDTTVTFEHTSSSTGAMGNQVSLSQLPPTMNLFPGSDFSTLARAELFHEVTEYPFRTAIKLFAWLNDTMYHNCSGMMVGDNLVLTAAHCLMSYGTEEWYYDSIQAIPAYDNGGSQPTLPSSVVDKYFVFQSFYEGSQWADIALLQLREPIGKEIGWAGIAFSSDTSYFSGRVFHKLSYPNHNPFNSPEVYTGDTLYYNYGYIDIIPPSGNLGINSLDARGIPGQSGSSFFYTDNQEYYSFGVLNFSSRYQHYPITRDVFYPFKQVIDTYTVSVQEEVPDVRTLTMYPNPASQQANVVFENPRHERHKLTVFDLRGQLVQAIDAITGNELTLNTSAWPTGLYFIRISSEQEVRFTGKLVVE